MSVYKISIVVPVYNVEKYVSQCLDSIINQTFRDFECICINDGSTDNSLNLLKEYSIKDERIKVIDQVNKGVSVARNIGIEKSTGKYICFVDPDDFIDKDYLLKLFDEIEKTNSEIVSCNFAFYFEKTNKFENDIFPIDVRLLDSDNEFLRLKKSYAQPTVWIKIFKRQFLFDNNIFFKEGLSCEDNHFVAISFMLVKKVSYLTDPLYFYRYKRLGSFTQNDCYVDVCRIESFVQIIKDIINRNLFNESVFDFMCEFLLWRLSSFRNKNYSIESKKHILKIIVDLIMFVKINIKLNIVCKIKLKLLEYVLKKFKLNSFYVLRVLKNVM